MSNIYMLSGSMEGNFSGLRSITPNNGEGVFWFKPMAFNGDMPSKYKDAGSIFSALKLGDGSSVLKSDFNGKYNSLNAVSYTAQDINRSVQDNLIVNFQFKITQVENASSSINRIFSMQVGGQWFHIRQALTNGINLEFATPAGNILLYEGKFKDIFFNVTLLFKKDSITVLCNDLFFTQAYNGFNPSSLSIFNINGNNGSPRLNQIMSFYGILVSVDGVKSNDAIKLMHSFL